MFDFAHLFLVWLYIVIVMLISLDSKYNGEVRKEKAQKKLFRSHLILDLMNILFDI